MEKEQIVVTANDHNEMESEGMFMMKYGILNSDEFAVLKRDRQSVKEKIAMKVIDKSELLRQIKAELSLLNECKYKIKDDLEKTDDVICTKILVSLCKCVIDLFDYMHQSYSIGEDLLHYYINFCQDNVNYIKADQLDILLDAVLRIANNQTIWILLIKLHLNLNNIEKLMNVFHEGVRSLKKDSLPLWKILIRHLRSSHPDMVQTVLDEGLTSQYENISLEIRPKYLEWCREFKDIDTTRNLFNELKDLKPACYKLYQVMIAIESEEPNYELDTIRKLFNEACDLFGRNNGEVWVDYMRFEQNCGIRHLKKTIYIKAMYRLPPSLMHILRDGDDQLDREFWAEIGNEVIVLDD